MKFLRTIQKNFKILFRLKTSLIAIIFGPLIVIFLIGLAFNSSSDVQLTVGYTMPDNSTLTTDFINILNDKYTTKLFDVEKDCIKELEHGLVHTCVFFPKDFVIEKGHENNLTFVVDKSRVNLAYSVIEGVSKQIGIKSEELSKGLAETLIDTLTKTSTTIDSSIGSLIKTKKDLGDITSDASEISNDLNEIKLDSINVNFDSASDLSTLDNNFDSIKSDVTNFVDNSLTIVESMTPDNDTADLEGLIDDLNDTVNSEHNDSVVLISELVSSLDDIEIQLFNMKDQIDTAKTNTDNSHTKINALIDLLDGVNSDINSVKSNLEDISRSISSIEIKSSDQIVNPINTKIETISAEGNQLISLLPYLIMLIIMFVGLLLSSTLVVVEKKSRAFFRVFTTPTKDEFFIFTTFITAFIIVLLQMVVIITAVSYFLLDIFSANIGLNILILVLGSSIFIMIGMAIGYLMNSQQGANMSSVSIGALFLMLSNFVLPIESIIPGFQKIIKFNPFVLASETLRKTTLFSIPLSEILVEVGTLIGFTIVVFILIIIFQKMAKARYFNNNQQAKAKHKNNLIGLWIKNVLVNNEEEFIFEIKKMSDIEYVKFAKANYFRIKRFISKDLDKPSIATNVKNSSKKELLAAFVKENESVLEDIKRKHEERIKLKAKLKHKKQA